MKTFSRLSTLVVLACLLVVSQASGTDKRVNLRGTWKFTLGDNPKFAAPGYNDSDWEEIYVPAAWQNEGFRRYNGYAWYRHSFTIEFKTTESLYLVLGRIDDVDEVYVNGHLIGSTGGFPPNYFSAYSVDRTYQIPTDILLPGKENVVAVRVYDEHGEGGIIGRNVGIYGADNLYAHGFNLAGNWKFHLMDDRDWSSENLDDSSWENIAVPSSWEDQGFSRYDGFAWYRKKFTLPKDFQVAEMAILLGRIDDMDEVFINGVMIGGTGKIDGKWAGDGEWEKPRTYFIPDDLLKAGRENTIAVRVYDQEQRGGIYDGPITILKREDYRAFWRNYRDEHEQFSWWSLLGWE